MADIAVITIDATGKATTLQQPFKIPRNSMECTTEISRAELIGEILCAQAETLMALTTDDLRRLVMLSQDPRVNYELTSGFIRDLGMRMLRRSAPYSGDGYPVTWNGPSRERTRPMHGDQQRGHFPMPEDKKEG